VISNKKKDSKGQDPCTEELKKKEQIEAQIAAKETELVEVYTRLLHSF
jgi:hypothetical protein